MNVWGRFFANTLGFLLGGTLGRLLSNALEPSPKKRGFAKVPGWEAWKFKGGKQQRIRSCFYTATFYCMGCMAKADGRVSEYEIGFTRSVMNVMGLDPVKKKTAINLFNQGRKGRFRRSVLRQTAEILSQDKQYIEMFVELQLRLAYADGVLHGKEFQFLLEICKALNFDNNDFERLHGPLKGIFSGVSQHKFQGSIDQAFVELEIHKKAEFEEIKHSYKRLMSRYHPDKLIARGEPELHIQKASDRVHRVKNAYDFIRRLRSIDFSPPGI